jgi:transposase
MLNSFNKKHVMSKFTGIDVSKQTFDCSITKIDGKTHSKKLSNDQKGFKVLKSLLPEDAHVVMEASGPYYLNLAYFLFENGVKVSVVNPLIIRRFCQMRMVRTKTDKKDAFMIREYAIAERLSLWEPDPSSIVKLKELNASIDLIEKNLTGFNNHLEALCCMPDADKSLIKSLRKYIQITEALRDELENKMYALAKKEFNETYTAIQTIPGIGPKSATMLIAITNNFKKFNHYKELVAYVGLNPRIYESGTSVKGKGRISKMGTGRLRKLLYLCSWTARKANIHCKQMHERLKAKGKPKKVISVAIATKLVRQAFAIGKSLKPYEINYEKKFAF